MATRIIHRAQRASWTRGFIGALAFALLLLSGGVSVWAQERGVPAESQIAPQLREFLQDLEHRVDHQNGEVEGRLREFQERMAEEQERLAREAEAFRSEGEKALKELAEHLEQYLKEHDGAIEQRLREMQESAGALGREWMEQFQAREQARKDQQRPQEESVRVGLIRVENRPAGEIVAELRGFVELDDVRVLQDAVIAVSGLPERVALFEDAVRELDRPVERGENVVATFYIVAAGGGWKTPRPLPEHLDGLRDEMAPWESGTHPVLLDTVKCRTRLNEELAISSHLPDAPPAIPQGYRLQIRRIVPGRDGAIRLENVRFEGSLVVDDAQRPIQIEVSPDVQPGQPTLLGSASVRGAGEAILLIGEITPVSGARIDGRPGR